MTAYINLYAPTLRRQRPLVSAGQALLALAVVLVAMLAWGAQSRSAADEAEARAQALDAQLKARRERLTALAREAGARRPDAALGAEIGQAEALLAGRLAVLASLEGGALGNPAGFSPFMRALARQALDGLWLTGFDIGAGGGEMSISGRALSAELLPHYIGRLKAEAVFQGRDFATLSIAAPPPAAQASPAAGAAPARAEASPYLEFALASARAAGPREVAR